MKLTEANIDKHKSKPTKFANKEALDKIKQATEKGILTDIAKESTSLDTKYKKWITELSRIIV